MSAADVCRASGLTSSEVSLYETGQRAIPRTLRVQHGLAKALGIEPDGLLEYLERRRKLDDVMPAPQTALDETLGREALGHWSRTAIDMARQLEVQLAGENKALSPAEWVRELDALDAQAERFIKTRYQRILEGEIVDED